MKKYKLKKENTPLHLGGSLEKQNNIDVIFKKDIEYTDKFLSNLIPQSDIDFYFEEILHKESYFINFKEDMEISKIESKRTLEKLFNEIVDFSEVYDLEDYSFTDDEEKEKELLEFLLLLRKNNYTISMETVKGKYQPKIYYKGKLRFIIYTNYYYQDSYLALVESVYAIIKDIKPK